MAEGYGHQEDGTYRTYVDVDVDGEPVRLEVSVKRTGEHYAGTVDGKAFRFMLASRDTGEREAQRALRTLAAWTALLESGIVR